MSQVSLSTQIQETEMNPRFILLETLLNPRFFGTGEKMPVCLKLEVGQVLHDRFQVLELMNVSSVEGKLYLCADGDDRFVAKLYKRKLKHDPLLLRCLEKISSPSVGTLLAYGVFQGYFYEIYPYYEKGCIKGARFSLEELKQFVIPSLLEGLRELHEAGICHGDVKPSNICLRDSQDGFLFLDFGTSFLFEKEEFPLTLGKTKGYTAPEISFTQGGSSPAGDYYALGATLFELYFGHPIRLSSKDFKLFLETGVLPLPEETPEEFGRLLQGLTYSKIKKSVPVKEPHGHLAFSGRWGFEEVTFWLGEGPVLSDLDSHEVDKNSNLDLFFDFEKELESEKNLKLQEKLEKEKSEQDEAILKTSSVEVQEEVLEVSTEILPFEFHGKVFTNLQELLLEMADFWQEGKEEFFSWNLLDHVEGEVLESLHLVESKFYQGESEDLLFWMVLYELNPSFRDFVWEKKKFDNLSSYGNDIFSAIQEGEESALDLCYFLLRHRVFSTYLSFPQCKGKGNRFLFQKLEEDYILYENHLDRKREFPLLLANLLVKCG